MNVEIEVCASTCFGGQFILNDVDADVDVDACFTSRGFTIAMATEHDTP